MPAKERCSRNKDNRILCYINEEDLEKAVPKPRRWAFVISDDKLAWDRQSPAAPKPWQNHACCMLACMRTCILHATCLIACYMLACTMHACLHAACVLACCMCASMCSCMLSVIGWLACCMCTCILYVTVLQKNTAPTTFSIKNLISNNDIFEICKRKQIWWKR